MTASDARSSDLRLGRAGALVISVVGAVTGVLGFGMIAVNRIIVLVQNVEPRPVNSLGRSQTLEFQGLLPLPVPWWVFVPPALALAWALWITWWPERWYHRMHGPFLLNARPGWLTWWSGLLAFSSGPLSVSYIEPGEGLGLYWVPTSLALGVAVVSFVRGRVLNQKRARRRAA